MIVKVINSNTGQVDFHETSATTWGELKSEVSHLFSGNVNGVIRETSVTLESDNAVLPTEKLTTEEKSQDFTLFFVTAESKAGAGYESLDFQTLRREVSARGYNNNGRNREQLIQILRSDDINNSGACDDRLARIEEKVDTIISILTQVEFEFVAEPLITEDEEEFISSWR